MILFSRRNYVQGPRAMASNAASATSEAPSENETASSEGAAAPSNDETASLESTPRFRTLPFVRGFFWPPFCNDWNSRLDALAAFEPRDDDVFVVSYPKCGHHWSFEFLSMIISGQTELPEGTYGGITQRGYILRGFSLWWGWWCWSLWRN